MRGFLAAVIGLGCGLTVAGQDPTFVITLRIAGLETRGLRLVIDDEGRSAELATDSVTIGDGLVTIKGSIARLAYVRADLGMDRLVRRAANQFIPTDSSLLTFFVFPGARVAVEGDFAGDFVNAYPAGDRANDDLAALHRQTYPLLNRRADLEAMALRQTNAARRAAVRKQVEPIDAEIQKIGKAFLRAHPASPAAVWLLSDMMARGQLARGDATRAFKDFRDVRDASEPYYSIVERRISSIDRARIGAVAPEIRTSLTYDGTLFELAELRGGWVVLDFWGTWCGPCMSEIPRMQEYQARHAERVRFVGIAFRSPEEDWRATIARAPLNWWQVRNGTGDLDIVAKFNVDAYPTKFLIDPDGKIVARFIGTGDPFFKKLDSLFGKTQ